MWGSIQRYLHRSSHPIWTPWLFRDAKSSTKNPYFRRKNLYFRRKICIFDEKSVFSTKISVFSTKKSRFSIVYFWNEEIRRRDRHHAKLWKKSLRKWLTISKLKIGERIFSGGVSFFRLFLENYDGSFELGWMWKNLHMLQCPARRTRVSMHMLQWPTAIWAGRPLTPCTPFDGETPSPRPPPYLPPRLFLPRACSSFPTGLGQRPSRGNRNNNNMNTIALTRGPVPSSRPGNFN